MKAIPTVSILTTAFNREAFINASIESVLASSFTDFELIIVDDQSTDNTVEVAMKYESLDSRVKVYVNEQNIGDYPNRNKAASYAKGKYLKYLDSDDIIYPYGLEVMVKSMEQFQDAGFGLASKPDLEKPFPVCISPEEIFKEHFSGYLHFNRSPGSAIIRREIFLKEGGFSGERMVGDLELWLRFARKYSMVKFPMDLYWYRHHCDQEFNTDYAKQNYPARSKALVLHALDAIDCPLSKAAVAHIKRQMVKREKQNNLSTLAKRILRY